MPLPSFTVTGTLLDLLGNVTGSELLPTALGSGRLERPKVVFTPNVQPDHFVLFEDDIHRVGPVTADISTDGSLNRQGELVRLLANDPDLSIEGLQWRVDITGMKSFWFDAPTDGGTINLGTVAPVAFTQAQGITAGPPGDPVDDVQATVDGDLQFYVQGNPVGDPVPIPGATWAGLPDKPTVIAAGADAAAARTAIDAASPAEVQAAVTALVNGAPGALDTLNELAAALGDDANFSTTVTNAIAAKYTKPGTGIPKTDLAAAVQTSLSKADAAAVEPTGTPDGTKFYRDDRTWATPPGGGVSSWDDLEDKPAVIAAGADAAAARTAIGAVGSDDVSGVVADYLTANPVAADWDTLSDKPTVIAAGADAAAARAEIGAQSDLRIFDAVANFGAAADGTTDDTSAIQNAIDAAVTAGGGQVLLPRGQYKLTDTITLGDGVDLVGQGSLTVLKPVFDSTPPNRVIDNDWVNGNSNISLRNFKLDRSGDNVEHGILLNGVDGLLIDGLEIAGDPAVQSGTIAISAIGPSTRLESKNVRVVNCSLRDVHNFGVQAGYVDGCVISNNTAYNASREVFAAEPEPGNTAKNVTISSNTIYGSPAVDGSITGLIIVTENSGGTVSGVSITGNSVRQAPSPTDANIGILIYGGTAVTVTGNTVYDMGGAGIQAGQDLTSATTGVVITGNAVYNCAQAGAASGISLRKAENCVVTGNYVSGEDHSYSVEESAAAADNMIAFNTLRDTNPVNAISAGTSVFGNKTTDGNAEINYGTSVNSASALGIDSSSSGAKRLKFKTGGVDRWWVEVSGSESGNSSGSNMMFIVRDDSGNSAGTALTLRRLGRQTTFGGGIAIFRRVVTANYTITAAEHLVAVTDTSAARTLTLPSAVTFGTGGLLIIKDESGGAATNNITINRASTQTIDGQTSVVINTNYGKVQLYSNGANWFTI